MNVKKRGLGKGLSDLGLSALLGDLKISPTELLTPASEITAAIKEDGQLKKLPINALKPGKYQPRKIIAPEALEELANSIRAQGVIQPIVVRPTQNNQYEIIAGERRWRAAQLAGLEYLPAVIREINDETAMIVALIENIQRHDLNVMEEAIALNRLLTEFQMTHEAIAEAVGKSRVAVTNILRLLKLHPAVRSLVENSQIEMGHARALLTLDENRQSEAASIIIARKLSVRETEDLIRKMTGARVALSTMTSSFSSQKTTLYALQDQLRHSLGMKVSAFQNAKGRGKIVIEYRSENELKNLITKLCE